MSSSRRSAHLAPASPAAVRPAGKSRAAKRGKQQPRPLPPADFFSPERFSQLATLLSNCALRWLESYLDYTPFFWGDYAQKPCSGTTIRLVQLALLRRLLRMEVERALRLLLLDWRAAGLRGKATAASSCRTRSPARSGAWGNSTASSPAAGTKHAPGRRSKKSSAF
jgi:hypothetical protein